MNCKPGDLAVVIIGESAGGVLMVVDRAIQFDWECVAIQPLIDHVDGSLINPGETCFSDDCDLRPIRDSDGQDETLTWTPKKVTA